MPSQRRWRQRLLGSLQGQLQLATYLVVFAGFTGASTAGLLVGQRNLIHNETQTLRSSAGAIQTSLRSNQSARANADATHALEHLQLDSWSSPAIALGFGSKSPMKESIKNSQEVLD
jgi:hypothetical protein